MPFFTTTYLDLLTPGGREGGTLIFSYIRRLRPFLGVKNFFFFFGGGGGVRKMNILGGMKILWIFFSGGHHKLGLSIIFRGHFYAF